MVKVFVQYFEEFRAQRGVHGEEVSTEATTAGELFAELQKAYGFTAEPATVKVAIGGAFAPMTSLLRDGSTVVFIPPVIEA